MFWFDPPACRWWPNQFSKTSWFILPGITPCPSWMALSARAHIPSTVVFRSESVVIGGSALNGDSWSSLYTSYSHHPNHLLISLRLCLEERTQIKDYQYGENIANCSAADTHVMTKCKLYSYMYMYVINLLWVKFPKAKGIAIKQVDSMS